MTATPNHSPKNEPSFVPGGATGESWSKLFQKKTDNAMQRFHSSLPFDYRLYQEDIAASIAHLQALCGAKVLTSDEEKKMREGLLEIKSEIAQWINNGTSAQHGLAPLERLCEEEKQAIPAEDDIHMWIEKRLGQKIGSLAQKLHTARSRNDQVATDVRLYIRNAIDKLSQGVLQLLLALLDRASKHQQTLMPGHTHLQAAQPISFSYFMLAYFFMFSRDFTRLADCRKRMNFSPLGSGAFAGVNYAVDRSASAEMLHFDGVTENAMDAVASRDHTIELLSVLANTISTLSRLAEDFIVFSSSPFGFIQIDDAFASGSSIMPNKKNPDAAELIRGKTGRVFGSLLALLSVVKGLPMAYNRDLQEDKEGLFDAVDTTLDSLQLMTGMISTLSVNEQAMREACEKGYLSATDIADYLVEKGLAFREAHSITSAIVGHAIANKKTFSKLSLAEFQKHSKLFANDIYQHIALEAVLNRKVSQGSSAPKRVAQQLEIAKTLVNSFGKDLKQRLAKTKDSARE